MITRSQALVLLEEYLTNQNLIKHCLATEAVMRALAKKLAPDEEEVWGLTGLLHDLDADLTRENPGEHGKKTVEILGDQITPQMQEAILSHNAEMTGVKRQTKLDYALVAGETITGLIVAATLVLPTKKLADLKVENVLNRFREKSFARGCSREKILECQKLGFGLEEFAQIALEAVQGVAKELGL